MSEAVCADCGRLFDLGTGSLVIGWESAKHVCRSEHICGACRAPIIEMLNAQLAATLPHGG